MRRTQLLSSAILDFALTIIQCISNCYRGLIQETEATRLPDDNPVCKPPSMVVLEEGVEPSRMSVVSECFISAFTNFVSSLLSEIHKSDFIASANFATPTN